MDDTLTIAEGYRDLGLLEEALAVLDDSAAAGDRDEESILLRMEILARLGRHESVAALARGCVADHPGSVPMRLLGSEAIRRTESVQAAHTFLLEGQSAGRQSAAWLYRLGCFEALLGSHFMAGSFLRRAFALDPGLHLHALEDPDLADFWDSFGGTDSEGAPAG